MNAAFARELLRDDILAALLFGPGFDALSALPKRGPFDDDDDDERPIGDPDEDDDDENDEDDDEDDEEPMQLRIALARLDCVA